MKSVSLITGQTFSSLRFRLFDIVYCKMYENIFVKLYNSLDVENDIIVNNGGSLSSIVFLAMPTERLHQ